MSVIFLGVVLGICAVVYLQIPSLGSVKGQREYTQNMEFQDLPKTPNCVMSTLDPVDEKYIEPIEVSSEDSISMVKEIMVREFGANVLYETSTYLHVTTQSRIMRYVDDMEFLWNEDEGVVDVRACARLGHSDMGANRARVEKLRGMMK